MIQMRFFKDPESTGHGLSVEGARVRIFVFITAVRL